MKTLIERLDDDGRWVEPGTIPPSKAAPPPGARVIRSDTFVKYASALCEYIQATGSGDSENR
jgi:hypothetical protein